MIETLIKNNTANDAYRIGFYGNSGVCLFKYFVHSSDPQVGFSLAVLTMNLICFVVIVISYSLIILHTNASSNSVGMTDQARVTMRKLQRKIAIIILTDFMTWIPFIIMALLYFAEVIDRQILVPDWLITSHVT